MLTVLLLSFLGIGTLIAFAVLTACMLAGQVDHDQHVIDLASHAKTVPRSLINAGSVRTDHTAVGKQPESHAFAS